MCLETLFYPHRVTNNIRVKKTRPEKSGGMGSSGEPSSNPYEVKPTPANPYEVKANPTNPYEVSLNRIERNEIYILILPSGEVKPCASEASRPTTEDQQFWWR